MPASRNPLFIVIALLLSALPVFAQQAARQNPGLIPDSPAQKLPLRRVVLYKSGVGYFEHAGTVNGNGNIEIDLTSSQLDDVLKSLTALDLTGGRISGANYDSLDPASHQLDAISVPVAEKTSLGDLLQALRGARVEIRAGTAIFAGRLLSVEQRTKGDGDSQTQVCEVSVLSDAGEMRSFRIEPGTSLRFTDRELEQQLARALGLLDSAHAQDARRLILTATGTGTRELRVSYTSEVPVWKTTYRIVLPGSADSQPLLQGWAIVDNTVGEDWNNVELSLAAGAPQSFVQQISQPYYARRPVVPLPVAFQLTPQTHASTLEETNSAAGGVPGGQISGVLGGVIGGTASGSGSGIISGLGGGLGPGEGGSAGGGVFRGDMEALTRASETNSLLAAARSINAAQGRPMGDLFEYKMKDRVTIRKNQSALVPIVQSSVAAEKVSLWNAGMNSARPLRALWLTNTSGLVLDGGNFSVMDSSAFAGEGLVDSIQPAERRLISYAVDLALQVVARAEPAPGRATRVRVTRGVLIRTSEVSDNVTYTVRNEDVSPRTLVIEHPVRAGYVLAADVHPDETTATSYRFKMSVDPKKSVDFNVREHRTVDARYALSNLNDEVLQVFVQGRDVNPELEKALREVLAQKDAIAYLDASIKSRQAQSSEIFSDQSRLRENMKSLRGSAEEKDLTQRYTKELGDQENKLESLRREISDLQSQRAKAQQDLDALIEHMSFDITL